MCIDNYLVLCHKLITNKQNTMSNKKLIDVPDKLVAYATNSSISLVRSVNKGRRNDRRGITSTRQKVQHYLHTLREQTTK